MSVKGKEGRFRALLDGAWRTGGSEVLRDRERLLDGVVVGRALTEQGFGVTLVLELFAGGELQPGAEKGRRCARPAEITRVHNQGVSGVTKPREEPTLQRTTKATRPPSKSFYNFAWEMLSTESYVPSSFPPSARKLKSGCRSNALVATSMRMELAGQRRTGQQVSCCSRRVG